MPPSCLCNFQQIEEITAIRREIFDRYMGALQPLVAEGRITLPTVPGDRQSNGHIFYLLLDDGEDRDRFIDHMRRHDVSSTFHYVPLHDAPAGLRFGAHFRRFSPHPANL